MEDRVDRVAGERDRGLDVVQERGRVGRKLEDVVQMLGSVAHPEHLSELAEAPPGQTVAARQPESSSSIRSCSARTRSRSAG